MASSCWTPLSITPSILGKIILPKPVVMTGLCCLQRPGEGQEPWQENPHEFRRPLSWVGVSKHNVLPSQRRILGLPVQHVASGRLGSPHT